MTLDPVQLRVLGALIEKEIATPEYYPLSLNGLIAACNQKSSRDPVMDLGEDEVLRAIDSLEDLGLTSVVREGRVPKFEHRVRTVLNLRRDETAILCLLFLRGAQTPGELRARADRLYSFDGIEAVESTLNRLAAPPQADEEATAQRPLAMQLPRQPGSREARFAHLLGGSVGVPVSATRAPISHAESDLAVRVAQLEEEVSSLRAAVTRMELALSSVSLLQPSVERRRSEQ